MVDADTDALVTLRRRIASQEIPPGAQLKEVAIAEEFGIPRSRVREALAALDAVGLVERRPNRGAVVTKVSLGDLIHLYEVRGPLEGLAVRKASENGPREKWEELRLYFQDPMAELVRTDDFDGFIDGLETLRRTVLEYADNSVLSEMLGHIHERTSLAMRRVIVLPGRARSGLSEHRAVLDAMVVGDAARAEALRRRNIESALADLIEFHSYVL